LRDWNKTHEWIENKEYLDSPIQFNAPSVLSWQAYKWYNYKQEALNTYFRLIGNYVNTYIHKLPNDLRFYRPFFWIYDADRTDVLLIKFERHFYFFIFMVCVVSFLNLQIFRRCCCKKIIVLRKKRRDRVDRDTNAPKKDN
jgi:hypothetical protein